MATPTITQEQMDEINAHRENFFPKQKMAVTQAVKERVRIVRDQSLGFIDSLTFAVTAMLYFFFTGLALLLGRSLPSSWMQLLKVFDGGRIKSRMLQKQAENQAVQKVDLERKTPKKYKIVDLESNQLTSSPK